MKRINPFSSEVRLMVGAEQYAKLSDSQIVAIYAAYQIVRGVADAGADLPANKKEKIAETAMQILNQVDLYLLKRNLTIWKCSGEYLGQIDFKDYASDINPEDVSPSQMSCKSDRKK